MRMYNSNFNHINEFQQGFFHGYLTEYAYNIINEADSKNTDKSISLVTKEELINAMVKQCLPYITKRHQEIPGKLRDELINYGLDIGLKILSQKYQDIKINSEHIKTTLLTFKQDFAQDLNKIKDKIANTFDQYRSNIQDKISNFVAKFKSKIKLNAEYYLDEDFNIGLLAPSSIAQIAAMTSLVFTCALLVIHQITTATAIILRLDTIDKLIKDLMTNIKNASSFSQSKEQREAIIDEAGADLRKELKPAYNIMFGNPKTGSEGFTLIRNICHDIYLKDENFIEFLYTFFDSNEDEFKKWLFSNEDLSVYDKG